MGGCSAGTTQSGRGACSSDTAGAWSSSWLGVLDLRLLGGLPSFRRCASFPAGVESALFLWAPARCPPPGSAVSVLWLPLPLPLLCLVLASPSVGGGMPTAGRALCTGGPQHPAGVARRGRALVPLPTVQVSPCPWGIVTSLRIWLTSSIVSPSIGPCGGGCCMDKAVCILRSLAQAASSARLPLVCCGSIPSPLGVMPGRSW